MILQTFNNRAVTSRLLRNRKTLLQIKQRETWLANIQIDEMKDCKFILRSQTEKLRAMVENREGRAQIQELYELASELQYGLSKEVDAAPLFKKFNARLKDVVGPQLSSEQVH